MTNANTPEPLSTSPPASLGLKSLRVREDNRLCRIDRAALRGVVVDHLLEYRRAGESEISLDALLPDIFTDAAGFAVELTLGEALDLVA